MTLVHAGKLDLNLLISKLTCGPAAVIGNKFGNLGTLALEAPADIVLIDPGKEWKVDPSTFASKGKNTPLEGTVLKGRVMAAFYQGKAVYKDNSLVL
jgi:dihydroorotase